MKVIKNIIDRVEKRLEEYSIKLISNFDDLFRIDSFIHILMMNNMIKKFEFYCEENFYNVELCLILSNNRKLDFKVINDIEYGILDDDRYYPIMDEDAENFNIYRNTLKKIKNIFSNWIFKCWGKSKYDLLSPIPVYITINYDRYKFDYETEKWNSISS